MSRRMLTSWLPVRKPSRRPRLGVEGLEDRTMPAGTLPPDLVVGRTLSAYTTAGLTNNTVDITYTVYNQRADDLSGVLLTTALRPGVSYRSASAVPDRSGPDLAWSLGTVRGYDRASVTLTVTLSETPPLQIDSGARAFATLNAAGVSADTPAAVLVNRTIAPDLLASTPDANTADPFVQEQAARLRYDPAAIVQYLSTDIGYESYSGSLRGARGALWSAAGNTLDEASLGVALLRASGIPARYARGTLPDALSRQLILTMFPESHRTVGYIPAGTEVADPASDPQLLAETRDHYWLQLDTGGGFVDADTSGLPGSGLGATFTAASETFAAVADGLRHKVRVKLDAEVYNSASALFGFGDGRRTSTVLDQTFNAVDLVGRPLTVGHFVNQSALGALVFSSRTTTYTPYILVGDLGLPADQQADPVLGSPFQEVATNFPFGSTVVTGVFLSVALRDPDGGEVTYDRALVDRIGFAARQGLAGTSVGIAPDAPPALTEFDLYTLHVTAARQSPAAAQLALLYAAREVDAVAARADPSAVAQASSMIAYARGLLAGFAAASDIEAANLARGYSVAAYFRVPRITMFAGKATVAGGEVAVTFGLDLIRNSIRAIPAPGQDPDARKGFAAVRGIFDSFLEAEVLPDAPGAVNTSSMLVVQEAARQGVRFVAIGPDNLSQLQTFDLPAEAVARITANVRNGLMVLAPTRPVVIDGQPATAWFVGDPATGDLISQGQDGGNGAGLIQYAAALGVAILTEVIYFRFQATFPGTFPTLSAVGTAKVGAFGFILGLAIPFGPVALVVGVGLFFLFSPIGWLGNVDPPVPPFRIDLDVPYPTTPGATASGPVVVPPTRAAGRTAGTARASAAAVSGGLTATWDGTDDNGFHVRTLAAADAVVTDANGTVVGSGAVGLSVGSAVAAEVAGANRYRVTGTGRLSAYNPAGSALGVGADWADYSAAVTGDVAITLTTDALQVNGAALPAGRYTVRAAAATLGGSGASSSPTFSGSATVAVTDGTVALGPGGGYVAVGGTPLALGAGGTLTGYTGNLTLSAGGPGPTPVEVALDGTAGHVLRVAAPDRLAADQNTPVTFRAGVETSFADDYTLSAEAPAGWAATLDAAGDVTVTPAAGLPAGDYPVRVVARSKTNPDLVAQATVLVAVTPTEPGVALAVTPDPLFTVPSAGAELPTAYTASVRNLGPAADRFAVTVSDVPAGFSVVASRDAATVPAGATGLLGLYLRPNPGTPLPPPGTPLSFTVTATSTTDPTVTQTQVVTLTMPEAHGLTVTADPAGAGTTPGTPVAGTLTLRAVGNVPETVALVTNLPGGLAMAGLPASVTLQPGQSVALPFTMTPAAGTPLNTTLEAVLTAKFNPLGEFFDQTVRIPIRVAVPGADALATAADAAGRQGHTDLAARLSDLGLALTALVQTPADPVARGQAVAGIDAVTRLLAADPDLARLVPPLTADAARLAAAATAAEVQAAVVAIGGTLGTVGDTLADAANTRFTLEFLGNSQLGRPQVPTVFGLLVQNTGPAATTVDLAVTGLPVGVTATFSADSLALAPGAFSSGLTLTLTTTSTTELSPFTFTVTATARGAAGIARSAAGAFTVRDALVRVTAVTTDPPFVEPGGTVAVSARILNAVNEEQEARVSFTVTAPGGAVVFTSTPVPVTLTVLTTLTTVDLGAFDTTGFARGDYTITVTVADAAGPPIPGAAGTGTLLVGTPVSATLTTTPDAAPAGTATVATTLQIDSRTPLTDPLRLLGQAPAPGSTEVVRNGDFLYVATFGGIRVYDIGGANRANPVLLRTVGAGAVFLRMRGDLLVAAQSTGTNLPNTRIDTYSLADPSNPQPLGTTGDLPFGAVASLAVTATHVFAVVVNVWFFFPNTIYAQTGGVLAVDIRDPAAPVFDGDAVSLSGTPGGRDGADDGVLFNDYGTTRDGVGEGGADLAAGRSNTWDAVQVSPTLLLVTGSTSTGGATQTGSGVVHVVDTTDPRNMRVVRSLQLPGAVHGFGVTVVGDRAYLTASEGGLQSAPGLPFAGNVVLAVLDLSDPADPQLLGRRELDLLAADGLTYARSVGGSRYAFGGGAGTQKRLYLVEAGDPGNLLVGGIDVPAALHGITGGDGLIFTTDRDSLFVYEIVAAAGLPVTARVRIPTGTGVAVVPNSFSLAPSRVVPGAGFDTYEFALGLTADTPARTITWQSTVTGLQPGGSAAVTVDAEVTFTSDGTAGVTPLADQVVAGRQVIGISPAARTVAPGASTTYTVTLANPTATAVTYTLAVAGVPAGWAGLPPTVAVAANGTTDVTLTLTPAAFAALGDTGFAVTATAGGATGSAPATLTVAGVAAPPDAEARGVVVTLTPATATAGPGTAGRFVVRLTNTGSETATFDLSAALPAGVIGAFDRASVEVPPGAGNFREVTLTVTPAVGTAAGARPLSVTAASETAAGTAAGSLTVAAVGVAVALDRAAGAPGDTFTATVTNTGTAADTFSLTAGGPGGLVATLGAATVTLQPGESRAVAVTTGAAAFAVPGPLGLTVAARSQAAPGVGDSAAATLAVPPTAGLTANAPPPRTLPAPGPTDFPLTVTNTGNTEDEYTATITATTGPVTAALLGLDGLPTQTIPAFRLPGLSAAAVQLRTALTAAGTGTATVVVRSLADPSRTATVTATLTTEVPVPPPVVTPPPPPVDPIRRRIYAVGAGPGGGPRVQVYDAATDAKLFDFFAYDSSLRGGVSVATADVTGDGVEDVVTGAGAGGGSHVKVFDGQTGTLVAGWFAYEDAFLGGVWVAAADLDGNGTAEVVTGAGAGGGPVVKVWAVAGGVPAVARSFLAFDADGRSGATVAVGRGADGRAVIAAGSGPGVEGRVRTFDALTGELRSDVAAFEPEFTGGVYLAAGDVYGTGAGTQFLVGPGPGGGPRLRVLKADGAAVTDVYAAAEGLRNGLTVAALDRPGGSAAVLIGAGAGAFRGGLSAAGLGDLDRVGLFEPGFDGGVFVG